MISLERSQKMRKLKLYIETSVINVGTSDQSPENRDITLEFFQKLKNGLYEAFTSEIVIYEISRAPEDRAIKLRDTINDLDLIVLEDHEEIDQLAEEYIKAGLVPERYLDDARHIATATYYEMDAIISWNFEHMVKLKTKKGIPSVNILHGYKPIEIIAPMEVD